MPTCQDEMLCDCEKVTYGDIRQLLQENPTSCSQTIKESCGASTRCGRCEPDLVDFLTKESPRAKEKKDWRVIERKIIRTLHLYTSLAASLFLIFFAVTGFAMNHSEALGLDDVQAQSFEARVAPEQLLLSNQILLIEEMRRLGARGQITDFERDDESISLAFKSAGTVFSAEIDILSREVVIDIEQSGFLASLSEIHRSKSEDGNASLFIDIMAFLMIFVSLSGLVLFFRSNAARARAASATFAISGIASVVIFYYMN